MGRVRIQGFHILKACPFLTMLICPHIEAFSCRFLTLKFYIIFFQTTCECKIIKCNGGGKRKSLSIGLLMVFSIHIADAQSDRVHVTFVFVCKLSAMLCQSCKLTKKSWLQYGVASASTT